MMRALRLVVPFAAHARLPIYSCTSKPFNHSHRPSTPLRYTPRSCDAVNDPLGRRGKEHVKCCPGLRRLVLGFAHGVRKLRRLQHDRRDCASLDLQLRAEATVYLLRGLRVIGPLGNPKI